MKTLTKLASSSFLIGFILMLFAAYIQWISQTVADGFGYTGLSFWAIGGVLIAGMLLKQIWTHDEDE